MADTLNLTNIANSYSKRYGKEYYNTLCNFFEGKTIKCRAMKWSGRHEWIDTTIDIKKVLPSNSGNPFEPEITVHGHDGITYTIHPNKPIEIIKRSGLKR